MWSLTARSSLPGAFSIIYVACSPGTRDCSHTEQRACPLPRTLRLIFPSLSCPSLAEKIVGALYSGLAGPTEVSQLAASTFRPMGCLRRTFPTSQCFSTHVSVAWDRGMRGRVGVQGQSCILSSAEPGLSSYTETIGSDTRTTKLCGASSSSR